MIRYHCQSCGAALEVRVRFRGKLVWPIDELNPDFSAAFPQTQGDHGVPRLVCTADALHDHGFHLVDGVIERNAKSKTWDDKLSNRA